MSPDRKNRSRSEAIENFIIKRFNFKQQLALVGLEEFKEYKLKLLEKLQLENNIGLNNFRMVHANCEIVEVDTGERIRIGGTDIDFGKWTDLRPSKILKCNEHKVTSVEFFYNGLTTQDGPFDRKYVHE